MDDHGAPGETPDFLARLGLRSDADARAIKRSYAREVKQIDQETDAMGFQNLRDAYETALRWAAYQHYLAEQAALEHQAAAGEQAAPEASDDASASASAAPQPVLPASPVSLDKSAVAPAIDPDALSSVVFDRLMATLARLLEDPAAEGILPFKEELLRRLEDDELFNITARAYFEARLAYHLAGGWQRGNEILLPATAAVFDWTNDRRRLEQFGQAGSTVNQAIDERNLFDQQPEAELDLQRSIITRLRSGKPTTIALLRSDLPRLDMMLERFPAMMHCITPSAVVQHWRERYAPCANAADDVAPADGNAPVLAMGAPASNGERSSFGGWAFGLIMLIMALRGLFSLADNSPPKPPAPALEQKAEPLSKQQQEVEDKFRQTVRDNIDYEPAPGTAAGIHIVDILVRHDVNGKIKSVLVSKKSGNPAFDLAVKEALLRSGPYLARRGMAGSLTLRYSYETLEQLSRAELEAISAAIDYQTRPDSPLGKHTVNYEVRFNKKGKASARLIKGSADPRYDKAVRQAILRAKPIKSNLGKEWTTEVYFSIEVSKSRPSQGDGRGEADPARVEDPAPSTDSADSQGAAPPTSSPPAAH